MSAATKRRRDRLCIAGETSRTRSMSARDVLPQQRLPEGANYFAAQKFIAKVRQVRADDKRRRDRP